MRLFSSALALLFVGLSAGCDGGSGVDAGMPDAGPPQVASTAHCSFVDVPPTGGTGGTVTAGALMAGTAEGLLDVPLGASLAAYTGRAEGAGGSGFVRIDDDNRHTYLAQSFAPSVGIETIPRIKALALSAGGETVVVMKVDLASSYQGFVHDVEAMLGPEFSGKILIASSHSHSSFGNYSGHSGLAVGFGRWRSSVYRPIIEQLAATAQAAIDAMEPAQIGFAYNGTFDPTDRVNRDRRHENDDLAGGSFDDHHLFVVRVDTMAGEPMALIPVFGMHGTLHDAVNAIISTDSIGGLERVLEEEFDSDVLVMHLQGAGGDVSPAGHGAIECGGADACSDFAKPETIGIFGRDEILAAYESAGASMASTLELEMLTRTIPLGPDWNVFEIRGGSLEYAPFDVRRSADNLVYDSAGVLISPIDEFNAPAGAALCDPIRTALTPRAQMPGTDSSMYSYRGCNRIEEIDGVIESLIDVDFEEPPLCETTRTTVSALRLGDHMMVTLPGEPTTLIAEHLRTFSPLGEDNTMVIGYAQNHDGYILDADDWLLGGYEPSITFWGPLQGEYVAEQAGALMQLAATPAREDGNADGEQRVESPTYEDDFPRDVLDETPGTVPATLPPYILTRLVRPVTSAQPLDVARLQSAYFTWIGEDPLDGTPRVFLERYDEATSMWETIERRSGRPVQDGDLILTWTPDPIVPTEGVARNHYYTVEFQAVPPLGTAPLEDRAGLPEGEYRFRVSGTGYELSSEPFVVGVAALTLSSEVSGADLRVTVSVDVPYGYRLLSLEGRSNGLVPLRNATVDVDDGGGVRTLTTDGSGVVTVPGSAGAASVMVTDAFGNTGTLTL
jgi:neutral ceramidase